MSEEIIREAANEPDVNEEAIKVETESADAIPEMDSIGTEEEIPAPVVDCSDKTLAELVSMFEDLSRNPDRMKMNKEAEAIKAA